MRRRTLLAATASTLAVPAIVRAQAAGIALVIGNSKYQWEAQLPNVRRDVPDVAQRFQAMGLRTELVQDVGRVAMRQAIDKFSAATNGASLAAFYFAGHGVNHEGGTYLVPIDADLTNANAVKDLLRQRIVFDGMAPAANRLVVLDVCRNNPAEGAAQRAAEHKAAGRQGDTSGTNEKDPPNTLVLFSTMPGRIALDGPAGQNSPFAAALLRQLAASSIDLLALPARLRRDLLIATGGRQVVWDRNNYQQPLTINGPRNAPPVVAAAADPSRIMELANAYAYGQQNGLPMPAGLLAWRAPANARDGRKVGSFKYSGLNGDASILVVLSVDETNAELVLVARDGRQRPSWRLLRGTLSGDSLEFVRPEGNHRHTFKWSDANSGKVTFFGENLRGKSTGSDFTRLDG